MTLQLATNDRQSRRVDARRTRERWAAARKAERQFSATLRKIARAVGDVATQSYDPEDPGTLAKVREALGRYAEAIRPWAKASAARVVTDVTRRDEKIWSERSSEMSRELADELERAPIGALLRERQREVEALITSIPLRAARRVQKLAAESLETGGRAQSVVDEIMRSGRVAESRARLIARTETSRLASGLVQARAEHVGSEGYVWRTSRDEDVRKDHRKLEGRFFRWDAPPVAGSGGMRYHPGQGPNCRCYPEPVIADEVRTPSGRRAA